MRAALGILQGRAQRSFGFARNRQALTRRLGRGLGRGERRGSLVIFRCDHADFEVVVDRFANGVEILRGFGEIGAQPHKALGFRADHRIDRGLTRQKLGHLALGFGECGFGLFQRRFALDKTGCGFLIGGLGCFEFNR